MGTWAQKQMKHWIRTIGNMGEKNEILKILLNYVVIPHSRFCLLNRNLFTGFVKTIKMYRGKMYPLGRKNLQALSGQRGCILSVYFGVSHLKTQTHAKHCYFVWTAILLWQTKQWNLLKKCILLIEVIATVNATCLNKPLFVFDNVKGLSVVVDKCMRMCDSQRRAWLTASCFSMHFVKNSQAVDWHRKLRSRSVFKKRAAETIET